MNTFPSRYNDYLDTPANRQWLVHCLQRFMLEASFVDFDTDDRGLLFAVLRNNRGDEGSVFLISFAALELGYISDEDAEKWLDQIQDKFGGEE